MAIGAVTCLQVPAKRLLHRVPFAVIHDKQIQMSVIIEIKPSRRYRPRRLRNARFQGDILKRSIATIAVQRAEANARHQQIREAVVIEIAGRNTHPIASPA